MLNTTSKAEEVFGRIQALYDEEVAANRVPQTAEDVPLSYEAITDEWLTIALCSRTPDAHVVGHDLGAVDDGTTNRRRIVIRYDEVGTAANLPQKLFCKSSFGLSNRFTLGPVGAIEAEVNFYNLARPALNIRAPEAVFAVANAAYNSIIMLKDISDEVLQFCDHNTIVDRSRAESQVRLLAQLHGKGASDPRLTSVHNRFRTWRDFFEGTKLFGLDLGAKAGFSRAGEIIPARTHAREAEVWAATEDAVARSHKRPHTLTHGDVHLKNWYVAKDGAMALSDWQCATIGHWGRDLAYAIGTALTVESRRLWEVDLIKLYLAELASAGGDTLSFDETWDIYRQQMLPALAWWTITLNPAPGMPDMQPLDTTVEFVRRLGTAVDDLGSLDVK